MAGNVVEWALRLKSSGIDKTVQGIMDIGSAATDAASDVTKLGSAVDKIGKDLRAVAKLGAAPSIFESFAQKSIPTELMQAPKKLGAFARAVQTVGRNFGGGAARGLLQFGAGLEKLGEAASVAGPAVLAVGGAVAAVGAGAAFGAGKFVSSVIQAQALKEDITKGLAITLKSKEAADNALRAASSAADLVGIKRVDAALQYQQLLQKGFGLQEVDTMYKRLADLTAIDPSANIEGLTFTIGQIKAATKLTGEELNQLATAGLEINSVYEAIGKNLGKTTAEVIKLKESGKLDSDTAIKGILGAIATQTGGKAPGLVAAEKARNSMSGILKRFENLPSNFLFSISVENELGTVKNSMNEFLKYFETDGPGSPKVAKALEGTFGALVKGFFGVDVEKEGGITKTIDKILDGIIAAKPDIESFSKNLRTMFDAGVAVAGFVGDIVSLKESLSDLGIVGTGLKWLLIGPVLIARDALWAVGGALVSLKDIDIGGFFSDIGGSIATFASEIVSGASKLGSDLIDGLTSGIMERGQAAIGAVTGIVSGAIAEAKALLGIASPSKVFAEIGAFTVAGFERGVAMNDTGAIKSMVEPPDLSAITMGAQQAGAAIAGGGGGNVINLAVKVDARGATAADAQSIADQVRDEVVRTLETLALQIGAAA